jgi:mannan endo-1,4-beta-mannosidase
MLKTHVTIVLLVFLFASVQGQKLVNPNATPETVKLKTFLDNTYTNKIISGQAFERVNEPWLDIISSASGGKLPAMLGLDFMYSTPDRVKAGEDASAMTYKAIDWVKNKGGIVEFHWHWDAPSKVKPGKEDQAFYTYNTDFSIKDAMANDTNADYKLLIRDMDIIAGQIKILQDSGVPIIWRPLHESEGAWFWWGTDGDACLKLYNLMYNRFTNLHKLNNIIWTWNTYAKLEGKPFWYPGDNTVDIIAYDYEKTDSWKAMTDIFGKSNKPFALAEVGGLPGPETFEQKPWLYFITWAYMIKDPTIDLDRGRNYPCWINTVYNHPRVITLSDLQNNK